MADDDCVFCAIVAGRMPANVVDEDEHTLSFLDIAPTTRGHVLVIPKRHARDIWEIEPAEFAAVARSAQRMAVRVRDRLAPDGVNLINSCGAAGWQTVFHLHVHVIPRYVGDGLQTPFAPVDAGSDGLAEVAAQLR